MANTQLLKKDVEEWYRNLLSKKIKKTVTQEKVKLEWGGYFEVDAVIKSGDEIIEVHCLSISEYKTSSNKGGTGKLYKIKADAMMMMGIKCDRKVLAFIGKTMYEKVKDEQENGRFPKDIGIEYIDEINSNERIMSLIESVRSIAISENKRE